MICYNLQYDRSEVKQPAEAIIYTPHGVKANSLSQIPHAIPSIRPLALIHGLHEVFVCGQQLNLGAVNGLEVRELTGAKYWITTHDVRKISAHISSPFALYEIGILRVPEAAQRLNTPQVYD